MCLIPKECSCNEPCHVSCSDCELRFFTMHNYTKFNTKPCNDVVSWICDNCLAPFYIDCQ